MSDEVKKSELEENREPTAENQTEEENDDERKLIEEEYRIWKKNTPLLYDLVVSHTLEWPSLTCQWFPDKHMPPGKDYSVQRLLLGTHVSEDVHEPNHLMIMEVRLPRNDVIHKTAPTSSSSSSTSSSTSSSSTSSSSKSATTSSSTSSSSSSASTTSSSGLLPTEGGYSSGITGKVEIVQRIVHEGDVNRARYMPQNPNIIATKTSSSSTFVFDKTKHPSQPTDQQCKPDLILLGHEKEGFGLSWNPHLEGHLLSSADDGLICLWDIHQSSKQVTKLLPTSIFNGHSKMTVGDVQWHTFNSACFVSVGDDKQMNVWDSRQLSKPSASAGGHNDAINSVSCNPFNEHIVLTGSSDHLVAVWDLRDLSKPLHWLRGHTGDVFNVQFSPFSENIIASAGADRRVFVWDLARVGQPLTEEDDEGPPELLFVHGGHQDRVGDFSWNPQKGDEWLMASVSDDNILQLWQMAETIYDDDEDENEVAPSSNNTTTVPPVASSGATSTDSIMID